jgi:hypothetical protein
MRFARSGTTGRTTSDIYLDHATHSRKLGGAPASRSVALSVGARHRGKTLDARGKAALDALGVVAIGVARQAHAPREASWRR